MPTTEDEEFEALLRHIAAERGVDVTAYKRSTLRRRTQLRLQALKLDSFLDYRDRLEVDPDEFAQFFNTVLINVTQFFRDAPAWDTLARVVLPELVKSKPPSAAIRIWSAACATGEEAYTLAMLLCEALGEDAQRAKIYATDVDEPALAVARLGVYSAKSVESVPAPLREKYFEPANHNSLQFRRDVRRLVIFGRHDLLEDAPISRLDLLVCRNALMYFNAEAQDRILDRFLFALNDQGFLFLGRAETLLSRSHDFVPVDLKNRIFQKVGGRERRGRLLARVQDGQALARTSAEPNGRIKETAFEIDPVAQFVVDVNGVLHLANEPARRLFNLRERDIGHRLQDLDVSYKPLELRSIMERVIADGRGSVVREVSAPLPDGTPRWFEAHALPLIDDGDILGVKFVFMDTTTHKALQAELEASHSEIETAYEELQSSNEELETTNEELHSTVEELETTNEELQSSNEELETMNEELHSANEELAAVNESIRLQTEDLNRVNGYLSAILSGLGAGVIVLNRNLEVQLWNAVSEEQWGLRSAEVQGKQLLSLDIGLPVDRLIGQLRACLSGETDEATATLDAHNRRGKAVVCTVRCRRLPAHDDIAQGVILLVETQEEVADNADGSNEAVRKE